MSIIYDQDKDLENKLSDEIKQTLSKKFTTTDFAKHMPTFWRLKRKLEKIEEMYPELYYRNQNIIEMFGNFEASYSRVDTTVHSEVEDVKLIWI